MTDTDRRPQFGDRVTIGKDGCDIWVVHGPGDCPSRWMLRRDMTIVLAFIDDLKVASRD